LKSDDRNQKQEQEQSGVVFRRALLTISVLLAVVPLFSYVFMLPSLPEMLPVKYDSMGVPSIDVAKTSWDMIFFSMEGLFGVAAMLIAGRIAQSFAKRTSKDGDMKSTKNTLAVITLVISILTNLSWFLTIIPLL